MQVVENHPRFQSARALGALRTWGNRRIGDQDLLVQPLQVRAGFSPQFVDQHGAGMLIGRQRLGSPAVLVQGQHQQPCRRSRSGCPAASWPQRADHLAGPAQLQLSLDQGFQRLQPQLRKPCSLACR